MKNNMEHVIQEKIKTYTLVTYDENSALLNLGINSMDLMRLIVDLEETLEIDFPVTALSGYQNMTPKTLVEMVLKELN